MAAAAKHITSCNLYTAISILRSMLSAPRHSSRPAAHPSSTARRTMLDQVTRERALLVVGGAAFASLLPAIWRRLQRRGAGPAVGPAAAAAADPTRSTTSSAGGGVSAYETRRAVDEYLQFHYGKPEEILPYELGPKVGAGLWVLAWRLAGRHVHEGWSLPPR